MTETMWRCDQVRAGRLYNRMMFDTREEAEKFAQRMQQMELGDCWLRAPVLQTLRQLRERCIELLSLGAETLLRGSAAGEVQLRPDGCFNFGGCCGAEQ